jgi:hypothetical protein
MRKSRPIIIEESLRAKVAASLADSRKSVRAGDVFRRLRTLHERTMKANRGDTK